MMRLDSVVTSVCLRVVYSLPYLFTSLNIVPFRCQSGGRKRRPDIALVFVFVYCVL